MYFQKQDLEGTHYNWAEVEKDIFTGEPSRRIFDRSNGDQVLFIINHYGATSHKFTIQEGKNIEQKIVNELPLELKSEISVLNWIRKTVFSI